MVTASTLSEQNHNSSSRSSGIPVNPSCAVFIVGQFVTNSVGRDILSAGAGWVGVILLGKTTASLQRLDSGLDFPVVRFVSAESDVTFTGCFLSPMERSSWLTFPVMFKLPVWVAKCGHAHTPEHVQPCFYKK